MNFDYMDKAVDSICKSLENEPEKWVFKTHTFHKKGSSIEYWCGNYCGDSITEIWNGRDTSIVFSYEQGVNIMRSYLIAREKQANENQKKVLDEFNNTKLKASKKPWYKFW